MRHHSRIVIVLSLVGVASGQQLTTVAQKITDARGNPLSGNVTISITAPCIFNGGLIDGVVASFPFASGNFSVNLVPTDQCPVDGAAGSAWSSVVTYSANSRVTYAGAVYNAVQSSTNVVPSSSVAYWTIVSPAYFVTRLYSNGTSVAQTWVVPTSNSPLTITAVTVGTANLPSIPVPGGPGSNTGGVFYSYQFGGSSPITGTGAYAQLAASSMFALSQTGSGTSVSPYQQLIALATQNANCVLAGPASGSPGAVTCRSIAAADLAPANVLPVLYGTGAPGSVAGNVAGSVYVDTANDEEYRCLAATSTPAPACTALVLAIDGGSGWYDIGGGNSALSNQVIRWSAEQQFRFPTQYQYGTGSDTVAAWFLQAYYPNTSSSPHYFVSPSNCYNGAYVTNAGLQRSDEFCVYLSPSNLFGGTSVGALTVTYGSTSITGIFALDPNGNTYAAGFNQATTFHSSTANCNPATYTASGSITAYTAVVLSGSSVATAGTGGGGITGVAQASATNGNPVAVCFQGLSSVVMDATATQGDLAITSTSTGGDGHDSGQTSRNSVGLQVGLLGDITTGCSGSPCTAVVALEGMNRTGRQIGAAILPAINLAGGSSVVTGLLPHANIASTAVSPGSYTLASITVAADGSITAASNGSSSLLSGTLASIPATCTAGTSLYQATDQPITTQLYACTSTNTWTRAAYTQGLTASKPGSCSVGQIYFATDATAGQNLYLCTVSNTWTQVTGGGGSGTVTVVGAGSLTNTALVTGGGTTTVQTPCSACDLTPGGALSVTSVSTGSGSGSAGSIQFGQGTAPSLGTTAITVYAPSSGVTSYGIILPAVAASGFRKWSASGTTVTESIVPTYHVCDIAIGDESASALTNAQLGPQSRICYIPITATIVELDVNADGGTPNVIVGRNHAGTITNIVSSALATAASGGIACSNTGGATGINGATTCSPTLQNTSLSAGDYLELVSGTAGGTAKFFVAHVIYSY